MDSPEAIIQVKNICKTYENEGIKTQAVCGASFVIQKGEFVAIMGPSGSGKSTLMQILGFLDRPTEGEYFFEGKDIKNFSEDELAVIRNKKVGFVFQSFNLLPRISVFENIELPLLYDFKNSGNGENRQKIMGALKSVGIEHRANYFPNQLSGGEKQRAAIARALVNDPEVIFADEPTGNLDSKSGIQVMEILNNLNKEGHTIILVTHENQTAQYAKRILTIKDGLLASDEKTDKSIPASERQFLK